MKWKMVVQVHKLEVLVDEDDVEGEDDIVAVAVVEVLVMDVVVDVSMMLD
jgi:hypothetical protein